MDKLLERVNQVESQINLIQNKTAYRDLRQMLSTIDKVITEISKESVECRRMKKTTNKYTELTEQADMLLTNLEQHVTFAALLK